ncbi:hypothetical protein [Alistipes onderdonkii]|uniref:hypothetical protein n=1 Tax=Alistipes onderdonkii TaxID=328813 RepID=UPI0032EDF836
MSVSHFCVPVSPVTVSEKAPAAGASGVPEASAEAVSIDVSAVQLMARVPYPVSSVLFSVEHPAASRHADANRYISCFFIAVRIVR